MESAPFVVTLAVEPDAQRRWDRERSALFPAGRTQVGAHVTLFHAVPGSLESAVADDIRDVAGEPFAVRVASVMPLGRGVAYRIESAALGPLHGELQRRWWPSLTAQDRQGFRPHVTVQNKVDPAVARATAAELVAGFEPYDVHAIGVDLWRYVGGPWEPVTRVLFSRA